MRKFSSPNTYFPRTETPIRQRTTAMEIHAGPAGASQWILTASIGLRPFLKVKEAIPKAAERKLHDLEPGDWIMVKDFRRKNWRARRWNGPYQILLTTETAVKVGERATWIHATHCKRVPEPGPAAKHQTSEIEISE
ncbi:uncharacterized protein LOC122869991 isoform X3 [Siniperca chuatsi]|uniref:uncharacterized protein LOC122869991 isoform X3 n=1 Tax=Siniperca chuatsi TaxID=119488 RepID=UPI001CE20847|nr:uncharacterized protein LOC122869991 isoform X3 [Siniperca chuatsi]